METFILGVLVGVIGTALSRYIRGHWFGPQIFEVDGRKLVELMARKEVGR